MNTMEHGTVRLALILGVVLALILPGGERGEHSQTQNVKPQDVDYPVENPNTGHTFQFEAILPPKIPVRFKLVYMATLYAQPKSGEVPPCYYVTDNGRMREFTVSVPVQLTFERHDPHYGEHYRSTIAVDRYLPGRCRWELIAGMYSLDNDPEHDVLLFHYSKFDDYDESEGTVLHCTRVPSSCWSKHPGSDLASIVCGSMASPQREPSRVDLVAVAEGMAKWRSVNLDAAELGDGVNLIEIGRKIRSVSFAFRDRDNPLPREPSDNIVY
jgi:hypothetical protein